MKEKVSTPTEPSTKDEKLNMTWKLLEEATTEDKKSNDSDLEPILNGLYARIKAVESSTTTLSIP